MQRRNLTCDSLLLPLGLCLIVTLVGCLTEIEPAEVGFEPVLVVQSFPQPGEPVTVYLTKTRPLWDPASLVPPQVSSSDAYQTWNKLPLPVTGAAAYLTVNEADAYALREDSTGYYSLPPEVYLPAPEDRLVLTITADDLSVHATTVIPRPARDLSFALETTPIEEEIRVYNRPDRMDTTYTLTQHLEMRAALLDPLGQDDFYFLDLYEPTRPPVPGVSTRYCAGAQPDGVSYHALASDLEQPGKTVRVKDEMNLRVSLSAQQYPRPVDRAVACTLRARLVQYGPQYERFLAIDYDPVTGETGSNVEGGLGVFTGIVVRDTTIHLDLRTLASWTASS